MMVSTYTVTRGERLYKNFDVEKAEDNRDALAKVRYFSAIMIQKRFKAFFCAFSFF